MAYPQLANQTKNPPFRPVEPQKESVFPTLFYNAHPITSSHVSGNYISDSHLQLRWRDLHLLAASQPCHPVFVLHPFHLFNISFLKFQQIWCTHFYFLLVDRGCLSFDVFAVVFSQMINFYAKCWSIFGASSWIPDVGNWLSKDLSVLIWSYGYGYVEMLGVIDCQRAFLLWFEASSWYIFVVAIEEMLG